jgi:hypothetical protein
LGYLGFIFGFFAVLISVDSLAQEEATILWDPEQRLSWSNFKAEPPKDSEIGHYREWFEL